MKNDLLLQSFRKISRTLRIRGHVLKAIKKVESELADKGIDLKIKYWISEEWFTPDSTVGIAIPFYLCSPKLMDLEKHMVGTVEGSTYTNAVKILRHEMAHVLDNAYQLRRLKSRQRVFGKSSRPYPTRYVYAPTDERFVRHLPGGYAQAHPCEDFAETFAVWLDPRSCWKKRYANTPAMKKLKYIDELINEIKFQKPKRTGGPVIDSISHKTGCLQDHYRVKTQRLRKTAVREQMFVKLTALNDIRNLIVEENRKALRYHPDWKEKMIASLSKETGRHPELLTQYLEKVQKQAKRQGVNLNRLIQVAYPKAKGILVHEAKAYFRQGRHQILL